MSCESTNIRGTLTHTGSTEIGKTCFKFFENHFFSLPTQGNIYTLVPLRRKKENCKILVASLQRKSYCIEYYDGSYFMHDVPFICIPNGGDIVSMDAFRTSDTDECFFIGITLVKKGSSSEQNDNFLNIYSIMDIRCIGNLDKESVNCSSLQLKFVPYYLYHAWHILPCGQKQTVWLLSGGDCKIHLFYSFDDSVHFQEHSSEQSFPEFEFVSGITLRMDIIYTKDNKSRTTATCGEMGNIHVFHINVENAKHPIVESSRQIDFDFPSSCVKSFSLLCKVESSLFSHNGSSASDKQEDNSLCTLIGTTLESCFVYRDIFKRQNGSQLPDSENYDVVTCCLVCDVNFDGKNEVILGTYGQAILIYEESNRENSSWMLCQTLCISSPVLALAYEDVLGDGIGELVVSSMAGIHIYQSDPCAVSTLLIERLRNMERIA